MTEFNPKYYIEDDTERVNSGYNEVRYAEVRFGPWSIEYEIVHQVVGPSESNVELGRVKVDGPLSIRNEFYGEEVPNEIRKVLNKYSWDYVEY